MADAMHQHLFFNLRDNLYARAELALYSPADQIRAACDELDRRLGQIHACHAEYSPLTCQLTAARQLSYMAMSPAMASLLSFIPKVPMYKDEYDRRLMRGLEAERQLFAMRRRGECEIHVDLEHKEVQFSLRDGNSQSYLAILFKDLGFVPDQVEKRASGEDTELVVLTRLDAESAAVLAALGVLGDPQVAAFVGRHTRISEH